MARFRAACYTAAMKISQSEANAHPALSSARKKTGAHPTAAAAAAHLAARPAPPQSAAASAQSAAAFAASAQSAPAVPRSRFLPVSRADMDERGIVELDFVFVSGDAYVDHSSFAAAILGRLLEKNGYTVGIIAQPDWKSAEPFKKLGRPRLAFLVSAGAMDSMVSNYTANNKPRSSDAYAHGGEAGHRPDRALIAYTAKIREAYKGVPVIIGGIEASLRRTAHYDCWSNTVRRSILLDTKADLLIYGMGERPILEIAERLARGETASLIRGVRGTCWRTGRRTELPAVSADANGKISAPVELPPFAEVSAPTAEGKAAFARSFTLQEANTDAVSGKILIEQSENRYVVQEPPAFPLTQEAFDAVMELPFTRRWHPDYDLPAANGKTGVPALAEVQFSLVSCRGCFGACSFCAITFHQGKRIQSRSHDSLEKEARALTALPGFKGYIHDVGGPTANFRQDACAKQEKSGACTNRECLGTDPCPNLRVDHRDYVTLLRRLRALPGVKKVFIRSGIRFDYLLLDGDKTFFRELCEHHVSGQLKVAPEHVSNRVLNLMRKSTHEVYERFSCEYAALNRKLGKKQYLVPYYIAGHPGAELSDAVETALYLKKTGFVPEQVQDFYPTPGSLATCMYYTALDPRTMQPIHVAAGARERRLQRALLQFNKPENRALVKEALLEAGRADLIGVLQ
ncbi:Radical SAM domain protein [Treponema brennaborense DSM 12168]|uniref:Radical SAM domain protein n=2 Tax=Treponema TaxID=157 RepID=F4LND7_TREBD|nr:Radical SAM domain protein [Treponema brennaborense DSM 12168]